MSYRGREIEIKLATVTDLDAVHKVLGGELYVSRSVYDSSTDTYWHLPSGVRGDFIRMRELGTDDRVQITVKGKDKGTNVDRIEVEIESTAGRYLTRNLLTAAHGKAAGTVTKTYHVYWLTGENEHTNVSCYSIDGVEGTYIEIESISLSKVIDLEAKVREILGRNGIHVREAGGSLYELYILGK